MIEKPPIRALCEQYNLSPTALVARLNRFGIHIPLRTAQQWYAGDRKPTDYVVAMIRRILELESKNSD